MPKRRAPTGVRRRAGRAAAVPEGPFPIVGVGASAGGLEAFRRFLGALGADTGMAYVLVQHLDPTRRSILPDLLAIATRMPVTQVTDGLTVRPNHVYVIPPPHDIAMNDGKLKLVTRRGNGGSHRPIDLFLRTLARAKGSQGIGVVLSGAASDGTLGLKAIKAEGGIAFAQEPSTAGFDGMPKSAIAAGCVDIVLPPEGIARELSRLSRHPFVTTRPPAGAAGKGDAKENNGLERVVAAVRRAGGVDLGLYDPHTVDRRVARRMALLRIQTVAEYGRHLEGKPGEVAALQQDCLSPVTSFFRDPKVFEALSTRVLPQLMAAKQADAPVRVWVAGCATGEEAYSIAICLLEQQARLGRDQRVQVFATDVSQDAVQAARSGTYPEGIAGDVSSERLQRFFRRVDGHYKVAKMVRDACVFAVHNVLRDAPFSRMDLICCRNLAPQLEPGARNQVLATLHYALRPQGFLVLGASEPMVAAKLFAGWEEQPGIYTRVVPITAAPQGDRRQAAGGQAPKRLLIPATPAGGAHRPRPPAAGEKDRRIAELEGQLDDSREHLRALLDEYDSADEDLRSTNEEALSANEELRNINEELETAKEEVQSANQELETLNQELHDGNRELSNAADDLMNLVDGLNLPLVIVGGDLTVRRFTAPAETLLNLIATDVGRPLGDVRSNVEGTDLAAAARGVIKTLIPVQLGVKDKQGRDYVLRIRPYRTRENKIDGAVIIFLDEAALKAT